MNKVSAIIVAAGEGKRFGAAKPFALLKGKTILDWSVEKFEEHEAIDSIILVLGRDRPCPRVVVGGEVVGAEELQARCRRRDRGRGRCGIDRHHRRSALGRG